MSHNHGTGYKGFRSNAVQACSSLKPGETYYQRNSKFGDVGHGLVYAKGAPTSASAFGTINQQKQGLVKSGHYRIPDRRGVAAKSDARDARKSKPFIATTTNENAYVNYLQNLFELESCSEASLNSAFDAVDTDNSGFIEGTEVSKFLTIALGKAPPKNQVDMFVKYFDSNEDGKIERSEFVDGFSRVVDLIKEQTKPNSGSRMVTPGWAKQKQPARILRASSQKSSYQMDLGEYGQDPSRRAFMNKGGMRTTTEDLNLGTTKDTLHIPGYGGFIPNAKTNMDAVSQGDGVVTRARPQNQRLTHNHNLPGYTGHRPVDIRNDYGPRNSGMDCRTSQGAAAQGLS